MSRIPAFLEHFSRLRLGIVVDDIGAPRSAVVAPAQEIPTEAVNRALALSGGLTFVALSPERANAFMLPTMARPGASQADQSPGATSLRLLATVEAREGISTGISAADRAATLRVLGSLEPHPRDLIKPGHIFPVETREGGVLVKSAIPEGALDLVRMAGFSDAALFIDLLGASGGLMTADEAAACASREGLPMALLSDLISFRLQREPLVSRAAEAIIPTRLAGDMRGVVYRSRIHDVEHLALVKGDISSADPVLVRVQPESTVADVFGGEEPNSRAVLQASLRAIAARGCGVFLYLRRAFLDERGGHGQRLPGERPAAHSPMMMREYGVGAQILRDLGASRIEVLSSSTRSLAGLASFGITIVSQHPIPGVESGREHCV